MFMSVLDTSLTAASYEDLAQTRVVLTGVSASCGVDVARAFADHKARLVVQTASPATDPEIVELAALLAESASDIKLFDTQISSAASAQRFAQTEAQAFGGVDTLINLIPLSLADLETLARAPDIEVAILRRLETALEITRIAANRMRMTLTEGSILNIVVLQDPVAGSSAIVAAMMRATLAAVTRTEAQTWAGNGITINAIGPRVALPGEKEQVQLASEPEIAAIALYLASARARGLSGHVFQAEGVLTTCS